MKILEDYRKKNGITQRQFAERLECSQSLVSMWINGDVEMSGEWAVEIERVTKRQVLRQDLLPHLYRGMTAA